MQNFLREAALFGAENIAPMRNRKENAVRFR